MNEWWVQITVPIDIRFFFRDLIYHLVRCLCITNKLKTFYVQNPTCFMYNDQHPVTETGLQSPKLTAILVHTSVCAGVIHSQTHLCIKSHYWVAFSGLKCFIILVKWSKLSWTPFNMVQVVVNVMTTVYWCRRHYISREYRSGMPCVLSCVKCLFSLIRALQTLGKGGILNDLRIMTCKLCKFESVLTSFFVLCSIQVKNDGI